MGVNLTDETVSCGNLLFSEVKSAKNNFKKM